MKYKDRGKRFKWSDHPDKVEEFLRYFLTGKYTQKQIAGMMTTPDGKPMRLAQIFGVRKRMKAGEYDDLVDKIKAETEPEPEPQPLSLPPPPPEEPEPEPEPLPTPLPPSPPDEDEDEDEDEITGPEWPDYPIVPIQPVWPDEDQDEYSPEGNIDPAGVGPDPECKQVFKLVYTPDRTKLGSGLDRMKRVRVYTAVKPGTDMPYTLYNPGYRMYTDLTPVPNPDLDYMQFDGVYPIPECNSGERYGIPIPAPKTILAKGMVVSDTSGQALHARFQHDDLGNWYVLITSDGLSKEPVTVEYTVACPVLMQNYWSDVRRLQDTTLPQPGLLRDALDPAIEPVADELVQMIALAPTAGYLVCVTELGKYCAGFGCGDIPPGDMVLESFKGRVGACRNRALDFFIAATRLGIVCRVAVSDCHAYVELLDPGTQDWVALDLGGCDPPSSGDPDQPPTPRNPDDLNPPQLPPEQPPPEQPQPPSPPPEQPQPPSPPSPSPPPPSPPSEQLPDVPERPEDTGRIDIRDIWRELRSSEAEFDESDIHHAFLAYKTSGGK